MYFKLTRDGVESWHRHFLRDETMTACGVVVDEVYAARLNYPLLDVPLCTECFSPREQEIFIRAIARADAAHAAEVKEFEAELARRDRLEAVRVEPTRPLPPESQLREACASIAELCAGAARALDEGRLADVVELLRQIHVASTVKA